jgi:pimeloyl-ACP methyl ester carboxylesterase
MLDHCLAGASVCAVAGDRGATSTVGAPDRAQMRLHERTVWGQRMLYREAGSQAKPAVLLLHGMTTTAWNITHLLQALAPNFHVIAPDNVGAGLHPSPTPVPAEQAVAGMSAHLDALVRLLGLTRVAVVAQDIAACIIEELLIGARSSADVWAVAVEALPRGPVRSEGGLPALVPVDRSPFDPAVHALLAAHEPVITRATHTFSAAGIPTACFHARQCIPDRLEPDNAQAGLHLVGTPPPTGAAEETRTALHSTYATDQDGTPVDHELCWLERWLTRFLLSHAPDLRP